MPFEFMSRRGFLTASTAICLTGLYGLYARYVNPLLEPPSIAPQAGQSSGFESSSPSESKIMANRWLAHQPWATSAAYRLRTADTFVYFENWESDDADQAVRFQPFAIIWMPEGKDSDEEPTTIVCDSAYVKFAKPFKITNPKPGRIIGGALEGNVRITGTNGLDVVGKNFHFSQTALRIWSEHHVDFKHGPHHGDAQGLQVELVEDIHADVNDSIAVSGIKSVQLRRNVSMELLLDNQETATAVDPKIPDSADKTPTPVHIYSAGSFQFVLETNVATYEDKVRVLRPTEANQADSLECDHLTLIFEPQQPDAPQNPNTGNPASHDGSESRPDLHPVESSSEPVAEQEKQSRRFEGIAGNLSFRRLLARGKTVVLTSEVNEITAQMNDLVYDAQTRVVVLKSVVPKGQEVVKGQKQVLVNQGASNLSAPEITMIHDEQGTVTSAWCRGAGRLNYYDSETGQIRIEARWSKQLRKYPDPRSELDIIELDQQAVLHQPLEKSGLTADFIKIWIEPSDDGQPADRKTGKSSTAFETAASEVGAAPTNRTVPARIDRLLALKNVAMVSPDMQSKTERLEVWFEPAELPPPVAEPTAAEPLAGPESRNPTQLTVHRESAPQQRTNLQTSPDLTGSHLPLKHSTETSVQATRPAPVASPKTQPSKPQQQQNPFVPAAVQPAAATVSETGEPDEPVVVVADLIQVRVLQDARRNESRVAEVWTNGNVEVTQKRGTQEQPLIITGDRLDLQNRLTKDDQIVNVYGGPAHIRGRKLHVAGQRVHLDRHQNLTWVNGAGLLQLPVTKTLDGEPLEKPEQLNIRWTEKMVFDGQTAKFFGNVKALMNTHRMSCQEMHVILTERLMFTDEDDDEDDQQPEIHYILCREGVDVESYEYQDGKLIEISRARFWDFRLNQRTGKTQALGPGWIKRWRHGEGNRAGLSSVATVRANQPLEQETAGWKYTRIDFAGTSDGNTKQKFATFHDRVQIVYGSVDSPDEIVDPDSLPKNGGWMRCQTLQVDQHEESDGGAGHMELLSRGDVELEGRAFHARSDSVSDEESRYHARADFISYDESKDLYLLRSLGNRKAKIWRQKKIGGDYSPAVAQRMEFIPARDYLRLDDATEVSGIE